MQRVFIDQDDTILAIHPMDQAIGPEAYAAPGRTVRLVFLGPDLAPSPIEEFEDVDGRRRARPRKLPAGWEASYVAPVPVRVSKLGLRRALKEAGLLDTFNAALAGADEDTREEYALAQDLVRTDPLVVAFIGGLKEITPAQIDELFRRAEVLVQ